MSEKELPDDSNPVPAEKIKPRVQHQNQRIDFGFRPEIETQDFYQLRNKCLANGVLFKDPVFPPENIRVSRTITVRKWKRPKEIVPNPQFFKDGYSRFDVEQYKLGNCWFLATVANLTSSKRLFFQVVPEDQSFEENYAGIFHFRFWQFQRWVDVVIDDRLPVYGDELVFLRSSEQNEFWSALLEKAYAKLIGSYKALESGSIAESMEDFTGGVSEEYFLKKAPANLFDIMLKAYERGSMMGCSTESNEEGSEEITPDGLVLGHAYSITKVVSLNVSTSDKSTEYQLIRIRNPWGDETEWSGPWSDGSKEWSYVSKDQKKELGLTRDDDGEFWVCYQDFVTHFESVEICILRPEALSNDGLTDESKKKWMISVFQGKWIKDSTAGGSAENTSYCRNPQYHFTLDEVDEGDKENKCTIIVAVMQNRRQRSLNKKHQVKFLDLSFDIWAIPDQDMASKPLDADYFDNNDPVAGYPTYTNARGITRRFRLRRGTYCLVPSIYDPNDEGEFFLRVISERPIKIEEYIFNGNTEDESGKYA